MYRAILSLDFTGAVGNEQNKLTAALRASNWLHVETSLFVIETADLAEIWRGIELVARQSSSITGPGGALSALSFQVVSSPGFSTNRTFTAGANHPNSVADILARPFPAP